MEPRRRACKEEEAGEPDVISCCRTAAFCVIKMETLVDAHARLGSGGNHIKLAEGISNYNEEQKSCQEGGEEKWGSGPVRKTEKRSRGKSADVIWLCADCVCVRVFVRACVRVRAGGRTCALCGGLIGR